MSPARRSRRRLSRPDHHFRSATDRERCRPSEGRCTRSGADRTTPCGCARRSAGTGAAGRTWAASSPARRQQRRALPVRSTSSPVESTTRSWGRTFDGGSWGAWTGLGGILTSAPAVVSRAPGTLDVFVAGVDRALWHRHFDGSQLGRMGLPRRHPRRSSRCRVGGTGDLGGVRSWAGRRTVGSNIRRSELERVVHARRHPHHGTRSRQSQPGTYDVFVRGNDNAVWQRTRDSGGQWGGWTTLGGLITSPPAAVSADPGAVTVFARGIDDALWVSNDGGGGVRWWSSLGGVLR